PAPCPLQAPYVSTGSMRARRRRPYCGRQGPCLHGREGPPSKPVPPDWTRRAGRSNSTARKTQHSAAGRSGNSCEKPLHEPARLQAPSIKPLAIEPETTAFIVLDPKIVAGQACRRDFRGQSFGFFAFLLDLRRTMQPPFRRDALGSFGAGDAV